MLRDALKPHESALKPWLWTALGQAQPGDSSVLPSAGALASYDPLDARWEVIGDKVARALVSVNAILLGPWIEALRPVRDKLAAPITMVFKDMERPDSEHVLATNILADFAADDPNRLAELLMVADAKAYVSLFPIAAKRVETIVPLLRAELRKTVTCSWNDPPLDSSWTTPGRTILRRFEEAQGMIADHFAFCQTMPMRRAAREHGGTPYLGIPPGAVTPLRRRRNGSRVRGLDSRPAELASLFRSDGRRGQGSR